MEKKIYNSNLYKFRDELEPIEKPNLPDNDANLFEICPKPFNDNYEKIDCSLKVLFSLGVDGLIEKYLNVDKELFLKIHNLTMKNKSKSFKSVMVKIKKLGGMKQSFDINVAYDYVFYKSYISEKNFNFEDSSLFDDYDSFTENY
jgi:hypothetical protein